MLAGMAQLLCPHCGGAIVGHDTHTAVSILNEDEELVNYHPNPSKRYKSTEKMRRAGLRHYYENREAILEKMREKRRAARYRVTEL